MNMELLAAAAIPGWIKWLHLAGVVVYAGGFLTLSRMLAKVVRYESAESRTDSYRDLKRMHKFVDWGGLGIVLVTGLTMLITDPAEKDYMHQGYFHMKLAFLALLVVSDFLVSRRLFALKPEGAQPDPTCFRILHGLVGLAVLGILAAIFIVRG